MQSIDAYTDNLDAISLEEFVLAHRSLVKKIALKIKRRLPFYIELEDLLQSGFIGLLEARENFKADMGASFATFASIRIRGAILDALRRSSWASRETMKQMRIINEAVAKLEQREQRPPTAEEVARELGISMDEHMDICQQISFSNIVTMEMVDEETSSVAQEEKTVEEVVTEEEEIATLKELIKTLPEREQLVLSVASAIFWPAKLGVQNAIWNRTAAMRAPADFNLNFLFVDVLLPIKSVIIKASLMVRIEENYSNNYEICSLSFTNLAGFSRA